MQVFVDEHGTSTIALALKREISSDGALQLIGIFCFLTNDSFGKKKRQSAEKSSEVE